MKKERSMEELRHTHDEPVEEEHDSGEANANRSGVQMMHGIFLLHSKSVDVSAHDSRIFGKIPAVYFS